ncbi:MAG: ATP-dependent DNA helicase RecG [Gemmatimonadetes bacterium]|nr:ATP-dependent DNA helicase RecG [Gemmatimonadota bacterium]
MTSRPSTSTPSSRGSSLREAGAPAVVSYSQLDRPVQFMKGVGPKRADAFVKLGVTTARDLLYHVPRRYDDASTVEPIGRLQVGMEASAIGRIRSKGVIPTRRGLRIFQAVLEDDSGMITVAWPGQPWLDRKLREGDTLLVSGKVKFFHGRQIQPREHTVLARGGSGPLEDPSGLIFVTYAATEDLPQWVLRSIFEQNLDPLLEWSEDDEYLSVGALETLELPGLRQALSDLHRPSSLYDAERGRRRLAFDELFFLQLVQAQARRQATELEPGIVHTRTNELIRPLHEALPFSLTEAQATALREIYADMTSDRRMNRMLQGDVGSGKTAVAVFAMLLAVEGGRQAGLMAPTEILAEQHARGIGQMLEPLGVGVTLLTGSQSATDRRATLEAIASGEASVIVGTHALIQEGVRFADLGVVVIDEQHRFGVKQRMALYERDDGRPDVLVMSATPIPRSLAMALYGDLDLSVLDEMPPGRTPVVTALRSPSQRDAIYAFVREQVAEGRQVYIVYPLVEESEKVDLLSATQEHRRLDETVFPDARVGLLHGQLPTAEKDDVMRAFASGEVDVLVATTVVEVGIDVPNASVMLIEHAERFGLSQLHQLRGRVGRGAAESHCILVADPGEDALERLKIFRDTLDGFAIARADLRIRGQGDLFGSQQHGKDPVLRFADLMADEDLLAIAQRDARALVSSDPELALPEHAQIREHLVARYQHRLEMYSVG